MSGPPCWQQPTWFSPMPTTPEPSFEEMLLRKKASDKAWEEYEKSVLDKEKNKKAKDKKGPQASKFEIALLMWLFSPIIGFATLKFYIWMGISLQQMMLAH